LCRGIGLDVGDVPLPLLVGGLIVQPVAVLHVVKGGRVVLLEVVWVLDADDVPLDERRVIDEVAEVLELDVHLVDGVERVHPPRRSDRHQVRVVVENLEGDGAAVLPFGVLVEPEGEEVAHRQRLAGPRVCPVFVQVLQDGLTVEAGAIGGCNGVYHGLERDGAVVVPQPQEPRVSRHLGPAPLLVPLLGSEVHPGLLSPLLSHNRGVARPLAKKIGVAEAI